MDLGSVEYFPALSREVDGSVALLTHSCTLLTTFRHPGSDLDPLFACLAIGVERLLKLVHGMAETNDHGSWPSQSEMKGKLSHNVVELDRLCREHVRTNLPRATHMPYITSLLQAVESSTTLPLLLAALERYAKYGRFHNLDTLAGIPPTAPGPQQLWTELESALLATHPDLQAGLGHQQGWKDAVTHITSTVLEAVLAWWDLYVRAAMHGCFGPTAKRFFSGALAPMAVR